MVNCPTVPGTIVVPHPRARRLGAVGLAVALAVAVAVAVAVAQG
ncbi:hypothetical protein [Streptomyces sp. 020-2-3H-GM]